MQGDQDSTNKTALGLVQGALIERGEGRGRKRRGGRVRGQRQMHLRGPLAEGRLEGCVLSCPWHGWQYDVRTGENEFDLAIKLETYDVQVDGGEIRIRV